MATFKQRTWKDRKVQYANRYKMTNTDTGEVSTVNLNRQPGTVEQDGDVVSAENMNDLEKRIGNALDDHEDEIQSLVDEAQSAAKSAASSDSNAQDAMNRAETAASTASNASAIALSSAQVAQNESSNAGKSADKAEQSKNNAEKIVNEIADQLDIVTDNVNLAKSWAVGETGTRDGEDTNNAKYYAQQAAGYAGDAQYRFGVDPETGLPALFYYETEENE